MKILCSLSSLEFNCDYFPGTFYSKESYHPIFNVEQKKLLGYLKKWAAGELTNTDSYLLFIALLRSSELVEFRVPVFRGNKTDSIVANNMEYLATTVIKLNTVSSPSVVFPSFAITPETRFLTNVYHWIQVWEEAYKGFLDGYKDAHSSAKLIRRESALQRMIKNPHKPVSSYATELGNWAVTAGSFPTFLTKTPWYEISIPLAQYWQEIIRRCAKDESLFSVPQKDLNELIEHCEDNIPSGSIYSNALFKVLRHAQKKQGNFLGLGDMDVRTTYKLLEASEDIEAANLRALIDSAPEEEPRPEQYSTPFAYQKAKMRWKMANKFGRS